MKIWVCFIGLIISAISLSTAQARGPYGSIKVGNWKGGAFTDDKTGAFSHCVAGAEYLSGIYFMVVVDDKLGWSLGFMNEKWSFTNGQVFQIALTFDGNTPFNVQGVASTKSYSAFPCQLTLRLSLNFEKRKQ